ncbi:hypothetical protein HHE03_18660 [Helicobacter heilmannii]|nr:hypothetical protein HHE03_18660 [Helicobacter heilmannii]
MIRLKRAKILLHGASGFWHAAKPLKLQEPSVNTNPLHFMLLTHRSTSNFYIYIAVLVG